MARLDALHESEKPQRSILATWIVEICLEQLNALRDGASGACVRAPLLPAIGGRTPSDYGVPPPPAGESAVSTESEAVGELRDFLKRFKADLEPGTVFHLISSHGRTSEMLYYAALCSDFERIVTHHLQVRGARVGTRRHAQPHTHTRTYTRVLRGAHAPRGSTRSSGTRWKRSARRRQRRLSPCFTSSRRRSSRRSRAPRSRSGGSRRT